MSKADLIKEQLQISRTGGKKYVPRRLSQEEAEAAASAITSGMGTP